MAVAYLSGLPLPLVSGYSNQNIRGNNVVKTQVGAPIINVEFDERPVTFNVSWTFTQEEFRAFDGYYKWELNYGALGFELDVKVGMGLATHDCFFQKPYKVTQLGKKWRVTAKLIALVKRYDTLEDYLDAKEAIATQ